MCAIVWIIVDGPKGEDFEIHVMCSMASQERAPLEITVAPSMWPFERPFRFFSRKAKIILQRMEGIPSNTDVKGYRFAGMLDGQRMECMFLPAPPLPRASTTASSGSGGRGASRCSTHDRPNPGRRNVPPICRTADRGIMSSRIQCITL